MTIKHKIQKLKEESESIIKKIQLLEELEKIFPDLEIHTNRWKTERFSSKSVNSKVNKWYSGHSCGCCEDAALEIYFYYEHTDGTKVHSNPEKFYIGEKSSYNDNGYRIEFDFESQIRKANIPETVINEVREHYKKFDEIEDLYDE